MNFLKNLAGLALTGMCLTGCGSGSTTVVARGTTQPTPSVHAGYALTTSGRIDVVAVHDSMTQHHALLVEGMAQGEFLVGIDTRPSDGALFGLAQTGVVYRIDGSSGQATRVPGASAVLVGSSFGVTFDAATDQMRVSSDPGMDLTIDVETGVSTPGSDWSYAADDVHFGATPELTATAMLDAEGGVSTQLFIDEAHDVLVRARAGVAATLETVGSLGVDVGSPNSLDIAADGRAFLTARAGGEGRSFEVDLETGAAASLHVESDTEDLRGLALDPRVPRPRVTVHALTRGNVLVRFTADRPDVMLGSLSLVGLQAGERVIALEFRAATHQMIAVTESGEVYVVDPQAAVATSLSTTTALSAGASFGSVFDPSADRLRLASSAGGSLVLDVATGVSTDGGVLAYGGADVHAGAAATITALAAGATGAYAIDGSLGVLCRLDDPDTGLLATVGPLGIGVAGEIAFDASAHAGALLAAEAGLESELHAVDLRSGGATSLGVVAAGDVLVAMCIEPMPLDRPRAYAVTTANALVGFLATEPMNPAAEIAISGLLAGEAVLAIARDPTSGDLVALLSTGRMVSIDTATGVAADAGALAIALVGGEFALDVDPATGELSVASDAQQSLRAALQVGAGVLRAPLAFVAGDLHAGASVTVTGMAYTQSVPGATGSVLLGIDSGADALVRIDPETGGVATVANLDIDVEFVADLDIRGGTGRAYAALRRAGGAETALYVVDLETGATARVAALVTSQPVRCFALGD